MYFLRAGEMPKIDQKAREEMSVFLLPHFERTVSGRKEVFFSRFTLLHIQKFVSITARVMAVPRESASGEGSGHGHEIF